jgi:hypothetical protein
MDVRRATAYEIKLGSRRHPCSLRVVLIIPCRLACIDMLAIETIGFITVDILLQTASNDHIQKMYVVALVSSTHWRGSMPASGIPSSVSYS